jgi:cytoskeletal protein CcmA (bactofilin family)
MDDQEQSNVQPASETVVGADVKIKGNLRSPSDINIYGEVKGQVDSDANVLIGEGSSIEGGVKGNRIVVSGKVLGNIEAVEHLEISASGYLQGDIKTSDLVIQSGAIFLGKCEMGDKEVAAEGEGTDKAPAEESDNSDEALEELEETIEE